MHRCGWPHYYTVLKVHAGIENTLLQWAVFAHHVGGKGDKILQEEMLAVIVPRPALGRSC